MIFEPVLIDLRAAEQSLVKVYAVAEKMHARGVLTEDVRASVYQLRDHLYSTESQTYRLMTTALRASGQAQIASQLPEPQPFPNLPGDPPLETASGAPAPTRSSNAATPVATFPLFAGIALAIAGLVFIGAAILVVLGREFMRQVAEVEKHAASVRENTARYSMQLSAVQRRYFDCLDRGGTTTDCTAQFPAPAPPQEQTTHERAFWEYGVAALAVLGAAALVGGGLYIYTRGGSSSAPSRSRPQYVRPRTARAALTGGYNMEVE